jgi:hypothetical protein
MIHQGQDCGKMCQPWGKAWVDIQLLVGLLELQMVLQVQGQRLQENWQEEEVGVQRQERKCGP